MKRRLLFITLSLCLVFSLCLFAACDNQGDSSDVDINLPNSSDSSEPFDSSGEQNDEPVKYSEG